MTVKRERPKAGLGLGSAMTREQIKTRSAMPAKSRKPATAKSAKPEPPKRR